MARFAAALGALTLSAHAQAPGIPPRYFDEYQCIFHRGTPYAWSWDLYPLRRSSANEYSVTSAGGQTLTFNICGTIREPCAPYTEEQGGVLPPFSHGVAIQFFNDNPAPTGAMCKDTDTCDFAVDPDCTAPTVTNVSCTANCEVIAPYTGAPPIFALKDENNPQGGIRLKYESAPAFSGDPFGNCPVDPRTGLSARRSLTIELSCDKSVTGGIDDSSLAISEPTPCQYLVTGKAAAACPSKGDPFDDKNRDAKNFGWVCLGAGLVVGVYGLYVIGDAKGWWDPIKRVLPACPTMRGGVYGGSYKGVSSSATAPSAGLTSSYGAT